MFDYSQSQKREQEKSICTCSKAGTLFQLMCQNSLTCNWLEINPRNSKIEKNQTLNCQFSDSTFMIGLSRHAKQIKRENPYESF